MNKRRSGSLTPGCYRSAATELAVEPMRIVDLSRLLPGPFATLCLQGLGATVVKVEDPVGGDWLRHFPPKIGEHGAWFSALNRGKRSVALDLKTEAGRAGMWRLLENADVLVESFRPGVLAKLGLSPIAIRERFPRLVVASITGWGQTGPMAHLPGHDIGFMSLAGMLEGRWCDDPVVPPFQWADIAAGGLTAALRILAAHRQGEGTWLDIAMVDALIGMQQTQFAELAARNWSTDAPDDTLTGGLPTYRLYLCADSRYISVGALEPPFLAKLAEHAPLSVAGLEALFMTRPSDHWAELLADACVVKVFYRTEVRNHPHVQARCPWGACGFPNAPTGRVEGSVPALGEHNAELLG
jgi:crotonobetainyl-CoA:carnitine CoA-transferase CaiB-like acyl-CoA transferase